MSQVPSGTIPLFESYVVQHHNDGRVIPLRVGGSKISAEIAASEVSRTRGYTGLTEGPKDGTGILFVFESPTPAVFWMKDVWVPLDIAFFDEKGKCLGYQTMEAWSGRENAVRLAKRYHSPAPAQFALETRAGWFKEHEHLGLDLAV